MPEIDGYTVLQQLQAQAATATIPFIFMSAKVDKSSLQRGIELGADVYLTKPFTVSRLLEVVQSQLG